MMACVYTRPALLRKDENCWGRGRSQNSEKIRSKESFKTRRGDRQISLLEASMVDTKAGIIRIFHRRERVAMERPREEL